MSIPAPMVLRLERVARVLGYETKIVFDEVSPAFCQVLSQKGERDYMDIYKEFNPWADVGYLVEMQYRIMYLYGRMEMRDLGDGYEVTVPTKGGLREVVAGTLQEACVDILIEYERGEPSHDFRQ